MPDAILLIFKNYIGLICIAPVIFFFVYRSLVFRYGHQLGHDLGKLFGPTLGLILLGAPIAIAYPIIGFILLGVWIAYMDHDWEGPTDANGEPSDMTAHYGWFKSLLGRDNGSSNT
ncbi:MAG: hypothetical protein AAGG56_00640 [Pseudomonadota bacterium]